MPRTEQADDSPHGSGHAIVIGASLAGLLAARVLVDHFDRVTLVERDRLPDAAEQRAGVPQGRHTHILLARGHQILEQLFPGVEAELAAAGAPEVDAVADWMVLLPEGWAPRYRSGINLHTCSRPLLEATVRRRLLTNGKVTILAQREVTGLLANPHGTSIVGVSLRDREHPSADPSAEELVQANLVVDASGRESRTPQWLQTLGYAAPVETDITSFVGYASRWYRCPADRQLAWKAMMLLARAPDQTRMGVIFPIEGDCWQVGLAGMAQDYPPTDEAGWLAFARSLRSPHLYDAIQDLQPISPISGYRRTQNRLRHYERLSRWPVGLVVLGDAVCAFNPIYGQGMTVAALGALALDRCLRAQPAGRQRDLSFQRDLARVNAVPWLMATAEDFRWPKTEGGRPGRITRLMHAYLDRVVVLAAQHPHIHRAYLEVAHLLRPPRTLLRPTILVLVAGETLRMTWGRMKSAMSKNSAFQTVLPSLTRWARRIGSGRGDTR